MYKLILNFIQLILELEKDSKPPIISFSFRELTLRRRAAQNQKWKIHAFKNS